MEDEQTKDYLKALELTINFAQGSEGKRPLGLYGPCKNCGLNEPEHFEEGKCPFGSAIYESALSLEQQNNIKNLCVTLFKKGFQYK